MKCEICGKGGAKKIGRNVKAHESCYQAWLYSPHEAVTPHAKVIKK
jgi:hypothetical protein